MRRSPPKASVHIITYNQAAFIEAAVRSAAEQDVDDLEVVVADDASRDETPSVLRALASEYPGRVRLLLGEKNLGITGNSNRALRECSGEFVAFQGGDDILLPGKIRRQLDWFAEDPRRVLCGHDVEYFDSDRDAKLSLFSNTSGLSAGIGPLPILRRGNPFPATSVMVRTSTIPTYGFDERFPHVSDFALWIDVTAAGGHWGFVPEVLARYRIHGGNITHLAAQTCWNEAFMTLGLAEAQHPEWASACRDGRARMFHRLGVAALQSADVSRARRMLTASLKIAPVRDLRVHLWLALAWLPGGPRAQVLRVRSNKG